MSEKKMIYLHPLPVRIWHWLNALGIVTLCITGVQIRFPEYANIFGSYRAAILLHNTAGIIVALSFSIWFFYYSMSARNLTKIYVPDSKDIKRGLLRQVGFYFFLYFFGRPNPHHATPDNKFNPMQKSAYLAIMFVLMPIVSLTGILLMNVSPLRELILASGGLKILDLLHYPRGMLAGRLPLHPRLPDHPGAHPAGPHQVDVDRLGRGRGRRTQKQSTMRDSRFNYEL